jgi:hypothetical protein
MQNNQIQRRLNSSSLPKDPPNLARDGAKKLLTDPAIVAGQKRQTTGELAAYHHGVSVDDEPNTTKSYESKTPIHPGMTARQKAGVDPVADSGSEILKAAGRLGRAPEKE